MSSLIDMAEPFDCRARVEASQRLGRYGWVVERTVFWLAGCRRRHRRFVGIATVLICHRRITKLAFRQASPVLLDQAEAARRRPYARRVPSACIAGNETTAVRQGEQWEKDWSAKPNDPLKHLENPHPSMMLRGSPQRAPSFPFNHLAAALGARNTILLNSPGRP